MLTFLEHFLELGAHHYDGWSRKVRDKQAEKTHTACAHQEDEMTYGYAKSNTCLLGHC
jgi:hypothetical protein